MSKTGEGGTEWKKSCRAPECKSGHGGDEVIHSAEETGQGAGSWSKTAERGEVGLEMGHEESDKSLLWCLCVIIPRYSLRSFIHAVNIMGNHRKKPERHARLTKTKISEHKGPKEVEKTCRRRTGWAPNGPTPPTELIHTDAADL